MEVCTDVLQATCYGRAARTEEVTGVWGGGEIQVVLAAQSGVSIKELCKVAMLESWTGICPGRALATHRGAEIVFCTWEPVEVSSAEKQRQGCVRKMIEASVDTDEPQLHCGI